RPRYPWQARDPWQARVPAEPASVSRGGGNLSQRSLKDKSLGHHRHASENPSALATHEIPGWTRK
ncbi:MAG: hypothetical protein AAGB04_29505, partial [Pseudomonadota bacterium]